MLPIKANRYIYVSYVLFMVLAAACAFGGLSSHLLSTDDFEYLADTKAVSANPSTLLSPDRAMSGRPVVELTFLLTHAVWGADPAAYHLLLIVAHLLASFGLVLFFRELGADLEISLIGSFLFLVGISHVQAVQWISCLAYPLALALSSASVISFARHAKTYKRRWLAISLGAAALAVLTHPASCMVGVFCVYLAWKSPAWRQALRSSWWIVAVATAGAGGIWFLYPAAPQTHDLTNISDLVEPLALFAGYLGQLLSHAHWLPQHVFGHTAWPPGGAADRMVGILVAAALIACVWRGPRPVARLAVWTAVMALPFAVQNEQEQGSRYLYFASAGSSLIIAWSLRAAIAAMRGWLGMNARRLLYAGALTSIASISTISVRRAEALEFYHSGRSYIARGLSEIGIVQLQRGLARDSSLLPDDVFWRLSLVAFQHGTSPRLDLQRAIDDGRGSPEVLALLGADSFLSGDGDVRSRGVGLVRRAIQADDEVRATAATAYHNIGAFYLNHSKNSEQAVLLFNRALALEPTYLKARFHLGNAFFLGGRTDAAIAAYREIIREHPYCSEAYQNLAAAHWQSGQTGDAIKTLETGVAHNPQARALRRLLARFTRGNA